MRVDPVAIEAKRRHHREYRRRHSAVRYVRGKPSWYLCETDCGETAHDWALLHFEYETHASSPEQYAALCQACHRRYDAMYESGTCPCCSTDPSSL